MSEDTSTPTEGAAPPSEPTEGEPRSTDPGTEPEDDLSKSKRQANHWQAEARKNAKDLAAAQAELEALRLSQKSEHEQAIEKARREGSDEATKVWKERFHAAARHTEAMRVMQAAGVAATDLVLPHLNLDQVEVDENGQVDTKAIQESLRVVLDTYPMLAAQSGSQPIHHADLGPKPRSNAPSDVNKVLREAMTGSRRH